MPHDRSTIDASPRYDERTQRLIRRFLASAAADMEAMRDGVIRMAGPDRSHPLIAGKLLYCSHYLSAIKTLAHRLTCHQTHLLCMTDDDVERIESEWQTHLTNCDGPERSEQSACDTSTVATNVTDGSDARNGQNPSLETLRPRQSRRLSSGAKRLSSSPNASTKAKKRGASKAKRKYS